MKPVYINKGSEQEMLGGSILILRLFYILC